MSTSGIRELVRSVVNPNAAGDFCDETMHTFFAEIKGLVNAAFHALYEEVERVPDKDAAWRAAAMARGLAFMNDRNNEGSIIDSVVQSETACRSLTRQYFAAMHAFANKTVEQRDLMHVNFVPFGTFIARLYRKLSSVPEMREKYFTSMSYSEKDTLLRDVLRQVMQASVVGGTRTGGGTGASFTTPIRHNDSVSNISNLPRASVAGSRVGASVANVILSVVKDDTGLSPAQLSTHNARTSRFSTFTPPSVIGGSVARTKVVTIGENTAAEPSVHSRANGVSVHSRANGVSVHSRANEVSAFSVMEANE